MAEGKDKKIVSDRMMRNCAELILKKGRELSLRRRHPWIFSGAVASLKGTPQPGETVLVRDSGGSFLAWAAYSPASQIAARVWSFREEEVPGVELIRSRMETAYEYRKSVFPAGLPDAYRLVNAESDALPGLIVDLYGPYAVCQISSAGMELWRGVLGELLLRYAPEGVYERSDVDSREKEGLVPRTGLLAGREPPALISFSENGIRYSCDPREGHKTGFYLDQRLNRLAVRNASAGKGEVLNCFSYTGGFGLAALKGGAGKVWNVDVSDAALRLSEKIARDNAFPEDSFRTVEADVFQFLRSCRDSRRTFDMIILDPPKFASSASLREKAARGYKDINLLAMKLLRPGGMLFTFSCSGAMDETLFGKVIASAAEDAQVDFRIAARLFQGPDHPVAASFPEGTYLKGVQALVFR